MIQINFTTEDINIFQRDRYYHPHPHVMRKMEVLFFKSLNLPHDLICRIGSVSPNTMRSYFKEYIVSLRKPPIFKLSLSQKNRQ